MKYLIVGLGNPGEEYKNTRHNVGFEILDSFAKTSKIFFKSEKYANISSLKFKGRTLHLIKPTTFMNLSGKAVSYWLQKYKVKITNLLIITDDTALPFGALRLREKGNDGGHNGLRDINKFLGHHNYARLRFGVGNEFSSGSQADYVLSNFEKKEEKELKDKLSQAVKVIQAFTTIGITLTMSNYNRK